MEERRKPERPQSGEAPFRLGEVFYSRTDERGIIESGNHVFARVSGFDWDELLGAPHKIVRHPDMPKAVFWLMWDRLRQNKPVGAYIKNKTKDGLHYWVYAAAAPCGLGFLSARIKPTSHMLADTQAIYAELRKLEREEALSAEESASRLEHLLRPRGFATYEEFSACALGTELTARNAGLGLADDNRITQFKEAARLADALKQQTAELVAEFDTVKIIPQNMRIIASRLEPTGGPISTLSKNYGLMSDEISQWFERNVLGADSNFSTIRESVTEAMFKECMTNVLQACLHAVTTERRGRDKIDVGHEQSLIEQLLDRYSDDATRQLVRVTHEARRIVMACQDMRRHALGLNTTRIMAKIEGARSHRDGAALYDVVGQLEAFQHRIDDLLSQIASQGGDIALVAERVRARDRNVQTQKTVEFRSAS